MPMTKALGQDLDGNFLVHILQSFIDTFHQLWSFQAAKLFLSHQEHLSDDRLGLGHLLEPLGRIRSQKLRSATQLSTSIKTT